MELPTLIGISGKARNGKDTAGAFLCDAHGYKRFAFADPLKQMAYDIDPRIDAIHGLRWLVDQMGWEEAKNIPEVRRFLQALGRAARDNLDKGVWIRATMRDVDRHIKDGGKALITDMRYENETEAVAKRDGFLLRIERPGFLETGDDLSETALDDYDEWDGVVVNDGTVHDLAVAIDDLLQPAQVSAETSA